MRLPDGDGLELVEWIQREAPGTPVAVITAHGNVETAVRALKLGAFDFVSKPLDLGALRKLVTSALQARRASADGRRRTCHGPRLLGHSRAMRAAARDDRARGAQPGAGAHLRRIRHRQGAGGAADSRSGPRRDGPFVPVNCGAIPTELMESELFGHKRGSFTGAVADKKGLVQSAEGGTLFLDEVADLPLHMQVKLLRVIQEKTVRPVGEAREAAVDVRMLSATHKNLARAGGGRQVPRRPVLPHQRDRDARAAAARARARTSANSRITSCAGWRAGRNAPTPQLTRRSA